MIELHIPQIIDWTGFPGILRPNQHVKLFALPLKPAPKHFLLQLCCKSISEYLTVNNKKYTKISKPKPGYKKKVSKDVYLNRTFN